METYFFNDELISSLHEQILQAKRNSSAPFYAAFDADGTLWDSDLGEQFFQYQIDSQKLAPLRSVDPWPHYHNLKKVDPVAAYLWLAQINEGQEITQVRKWAKEVVEEKGARCFESQKQMISWLQDQDIEVFIVTASIQWAVEPAAELMGIPFENVLGIKTKVENGIVTATQEGPITWRKGKAEALLAKTKGIAPIFCSGNTLGDIALVETSKGARLCVQTQTEENDLFEEEKKLKDHAQQQGWPIHHFFKA